MLPKVHHYVQNAFVSHKIRPILVVHTRPEALDAMLYIHINRNISEV